MIRKITISNCKSYKDTASMETDKNINLIYGLNGAGKSTFSEYLKNPDDTMFSECFIEPEMDMESEEILVYNEKYVREIFYSSETQKGIFSLSKENAEARKKIDEAESKIKALSEQVQIKEKALSSLDKDWSVKQGKYRDHFWEIKQKYTGGDRVLEYCLEGLKSSKDSLFQHLLRLEMQSCEPDYSVELLRKELQQLEDFKGNPMPLYPMIAFPGLDIEKESIFKEIITGNKNSKVAELIDRFHNSDWVKSGLQIDSEGICPFCQRPYTHDILTDLKEYFNKEYESALDRIRNMGMAYSEGLKSLPEVNLATNEIVRHMSDAFGLAYSEFRNELESNLGLMRDKYKTPSIIVNLADTSAHMKKVNDIVAQANELIAIFNEKLAHISSEKASIKKKFWDLMRYRYASSIDEYIADKRAYDSQRNKHQKNLDDLNSQIKMFRQTIEEEMGNIVNIDTAVNHINAMLIDLAITDFRIVKCSNEDGLYRIVRENENKSVFQTLSEGERTIISILYFIEMCQGLMSKDSAMKKRIVVIDDPVSSLSNLYIYNIGRLIRNVFFPSFRRKADEDGIEVIPKFEQVFILTHSLYFFYEMTEMDKDKRHASQALFRITKRENGSRIEVMKYEHIQSDYQTYWLIVNDPSSKPALLANCMRNIIEYFFNFVEKRDLNNVFNQDAFKNPKYQSLMRYINRESHSLGQNIYDFKDFDYDIFKEVLKLIFYEMGYKKHYDKMANIK